MKEEKGKVLKVFIPRQYKNNMLLDVMDRTIIGFEVLVDNEKKEYIVEINTKTGAILKNDNVIIRKQNISGQEFIDIEKYNGEI